MPRILRRHTIASAPITALVLLLALLSGPSRGQGPLPMPMLKGPAPLLYVRFAGPPGMHVTFYQGRAQGRDFPAPVVVGLRPGYLYRVRLTGFPDNPGLSLSPTLEVRGSLHMTPTSTPADYPAPVVFTDQDVGDVQGGALLTKVVYLECPETAVGTATRADQPLEFTLPANRDLLTEARDLGRPMLLIRLGQRDVP